MAFAASSWATRAAAVAAALVASAPALARADDLGALVWVVVIWPAGLIIALALIVLSVVSLVVSRPAPRLGLACFIASVVGALGYAGIVEALADERGRTSNIDVVTIVPVVGLAVLCGAAGWRARRAPPRS